MANYGSVAVVIPTFNRRDLVVQAVRSVLDQTYPDVHCVVVDNGSTDGTAGALARFQGPRMTMVSDERPLGPGNARNLGIAAAPGTDWIAFLDSDDLWAPRKVELQLAAMGANASARLSATATISVDPALNVRGAERLGLGRPAPGEALLVTHQDFLTQLREKQSISITMSTFLAASELVEEVGRYDPTLSQGEDWDLILRLARLSDLAYVDMPLMAYRSWEGQVSHDWKEAMRGNAAVRARHLPSTPETRQQLTGWALYRARRHVSEGDRVAGSWNYVRAAWSGHAPGQLAYALGAMVSPSFTEKRLRRFDRAAQSDGLPAGWSQEAEPWLAGYRAHDDGSDLVRL